MRIEGKLKNCTTTKISTDCADFRRLKKTPRGTICGNVKRPIRCATKKANVIEN